MKPFRDSSDASSPRAAVAAALTLAFVFLAACFNPRITSGSLRCAPTGKPCPDNFNCNASGFCVTAGSPLGGTGGTAGSSGGTGGDTSCANPVAALCAPPGGLGGCDPICQTGCTCGLECGITSTGSPACFDNPGTKVTGQVCTPGSQECVPGDVCLKETCGNNLGRCYRFCRTDNECKPGVCLTQVTSSSNASTGLMACNQGNVMCQAFENMGCPDNAFVCYITGPNLTACDCPNPVPSDQKQIGDACLGYNDCALHLACLDLSDGAGRRCYKLCKTNTDCPGTMCTTVGGTAGFYCPIPPTTM
jgi:hypothetical protein